jgi:3',5'-nucleoside bisphosphate phosphatase
MRQVDLHSHSRASDGLYTPTELVQHAARSGVEMLALTDHDNIAGLDEARQAAAAAGITFINGVEISVTWRRRTLHIVGLNIDPANAALCAGLANVRAGRMARARRISEELAKHGIENSLEGARAYAGNPEMIGRAHFARYLVELGLAKNVKSVFKKYLAGGKPGHVRHEWAGLEEALAWIHGSGGQAVLAHPGRYDMGPDSMRELLAEFKDLGGNAIEVVTGSHTPEQYALYGRLAHEFGFLASCGSDFHGPGESYFAMGQMPALPAGLSPVWAQWEQAA